MEYLRTKFHGRDGSVIYVIEDLSIEVFQEPGLFLKIKEIAHPLAARLGHSLPHRIILEQKLDIARQAFPVSLGRQETSFAMLDRLRDTTQGKAHDWKMHCLCFRKDNPKRLSGTRNRPHAGDAKYKGTIHPGTHHVWGLRSQKSVAPEVFPRQLF